MAAKKKPSLRPNRLMKLTSAYVRRFKTRVPTSRVRAVAFGRASAAEHEKLIRAALREGRPNPEWESELQAMRQARDSGQRVPVDALADLAPLDPEPPEPTPTGASTSPD
jgi:hypothetical protein